MTQAPPPASAMDAESRAVSALVDPAELVDLAGALIRIPSFKTEETPVARFLDGFFRADHLVTVHSGIVHLAIHVYGVTGHIGHLEGTVNAVAKMTVVIDALARVRFRHAPRPDLPAFPRLNVGGILGGRGPDYVLVEPPYVPDLCTIMVDVHFVPGQTVDGIVADIRAVLDAVAARDPDLTYEIEIPPPARFKGRRRLVMDPLDIPA